MILFTDEQSDVLQCMQTSVMHSADAKNTCHTCLEDGQSKQRGAKLPALCGELKHVSQSLSLFD